MFLDFLVWGCQLSLQTPGAVLIQCWQTAPISVTVLNRFAALENVCLTLSLSPFSFVKMQEMPGTIFAQASKMISVVFGLKLFWRKKWGKTYLVLLEVKTGGWENLFASMEKHACFWRINKDGWSYLGPALPRNSSGGWAIHFFMPTPVPHLRTWAQAAAGPQQ